MNKKLICFILILSFLIPFLPSFDFVVRADSPSMSEDFAAFIDNNFYVDDDGLLKPKQFAPLSQRVNWVLADAGYVLKDPVSAIVDSLQSATNLQLLTKENVMEYGETINYDYSSLSQNIVNNSITYAKDNLSYYIYDFININDFFTFYNFSNYSGVNSNLSVFKSALESYCSDSDFVYMLSSKNRNYVTYLFDSTFVKIPRSFFDDGFLVLSGGSFSDIVNYRYQSFRVPADGSSLPSNVNLNGSLSLYDGLSYVSSLDGMEIYDILSDSSGDKFNTFQRYFGSLSAYPFRIGLINVSTGWFSSNSFFGTCFIYSGQSFSVPVFRSTNLISDFLSGNASVYKFNSDIDLGQFGEDIDYSKLYDLISSTVQGNTGNVIESINNVADKYLQQQLDLLHDINNALNDGNGQSWLRRIYGILDYNFPLTLTALQDLKHAIENISVTGGSADLTYTNHVLDQINDKLGFLIDQPILDGTPQDFEELRTLAQNKFPFCVFSDIVALTVILNQSPEEPHWQVPLKLPGSSSANNVEVDLSWYEYIRDYVHAIFIFMFIIGLLVLSVKIFDAVKS